MTIDEVTLRAYVDSELSSQEKLLVEAAIANSPELRSKLDALKASCLPYQAAFDAQEVPPMPSALHNRLTDLSSVASRPPLANTRRSWVGGGLAIAASFVAGAVFKPLWNSSNDNAGGSEPVADWVKAVANYQAMYVRETLEGVVDSKTNTQRVIGDFSAQTQASMLVPDLTRVGLVFKRAQRLAFANSALIQMAYLPEVGNPAALCVVKALNREKATVSGRRMEDLSIVTWRLQGLAFVFAVDLPLEPAITIGQTLASNGFPVLYRS
jgi:anti-sigma factor RsiW